MAREAPAGSRRWWQTTAVLLLVATTVLSSEPERIVQEAATALARTSYTWEVTGRLRFRGENPQPRLDPGAAAELRGRTAGHGLMQLTQTAGRELPAPVTVIVRDGDVVAETPAGWLRRAALRTQPGADREVSVGGKSVRLSRILAAALKLTSARPLTEDLFDLLAEVKAWREVGGLVVAELREQKIEQLWGDTQARRAPEVHGSVIFKLREGDLAEYHVVLGVGFPNTRTKQTDWSMQQWTVRISDVGTTEVAVPEAAAQALDRD